MYYFVKDIPGPVATMVAALVSALATTCAAVVAAFFVRRQWLTAEGQAKTALDQLRYNLFERRLAIYRDVENLIRLLINDSQRLTASDVIPYYKSMDEAVFFFSDEICAWMNEVKSDCQRFILARDSRSANPSEYWDMSKRLEGHLRGMLDRSRYDIGFHQLIYRPKRSTSDKATGKIWSRAAMAKRVPTTMRVAIVLIGVGVASVFVYKAAVDSPRKQTRYADLQLGMTMAETEYAKGYPTAVQDPESGTDKMPFRKYFGDLTKGKAPDQPDEYHSVEDYREWEYELGSNGTRIDIKFSPNTKRINHIGCASFGAMECPPLLGIHDGMSEADVIGRPGEPSHQKLEDWLPVGSRSVTKVITYDRLNAQFYLSKMRVYGLVVEDFSTIGTASP